MYTDETDATLALLNSSLKNKDQERGEALEQCFYFFLSSQ